MDEFASGLIKKFNFKPKYIRKLKYMYVCNTDKGLKMIKPVDCHPEKIMFVHKIKEHLKAQGFFNIDFYHLSENGLPYAINEDITYVMTDYFELDECDFSNMENIKSTTTLLANFHKFSQGSLKKLDESKIGFINTFEKFEKKIEALKRMKKQVSKQKNLTDFEVCFIKNYEYFYKISIETLEIIHKYNYNNIDKMAAKNVMVCHNKIKEESIYIGKNNYLTNLENLSIDHFVHDLSSFIIRYIRKHGDEYISIEEILNIYTKINYIDASILPILYALIKFPNKYIDTCQSFFDRKRIFTPISISSQIDNILENKTFNEQFLSKISF